LIVEAIGLRSGRFAVELMDVRRGRSIDRDPAGLHGFRNFASQFNAEQTIFKRRVLDLDIIGQVELTPEGAGGNTPIEIFALLLLGLLTFDRQNILFSRHGDVVGTEARDRQRNLVAVVAEPFDVVRRIVVITTGPLAASTISRKRSKPMVDRERGA